MKITSALAAFAVCLLPLTASADLVTGTIFTSGFTAAEGYTDGGASGQPFFAGGGTQAAYVIDSVTGTLNHTAPGAFVRAQIGPGMTGETVAVNDMIILEATGYTVLSGNNNGRLGFGLSTGGGGGAAQITMGSQLSIDGMGNVFVENAAFGVDTANRVDTTFNVGDTFDYAIKFTAETAGAVDVASYTIEHQINGATLLTENAITPGGTFDPFNFFSVIVNDQGANAAFSLDQITHRTVGAAVPEPSSLLVLSGIALLGLGKRRRRG